MTNKLPPRPTDTELEILQVLWRRGPSTVRQVHKALNQERHTPVGYTTTLKMMQVMTAKGLVVRDETERPQLYESRQPREQTQRQLLRDLLDRAFGGSAKQLVMQALADGEASEGELAQIEELLNRLEGGET